MTDIDVPDWVVTEAVEAFLSSTGQAHKVTDLQRELTRECMVPALRAALSAWVVPAKYEVRDRFMESGWGSWQTLNYEKDRDVIFDRMSRADGWEAEKRDLYALRQEKPE